MIIIVCIPQLLMLHSRVILSGTHLSLLNSLNIAHTQKKTSIFQSNLHGLAFIICVCVMICWIGIFITHSSQTTKTRTYFSPMWIRLDVHVTRKVEYAGINRIIIPDIGEPYMRAQESQHIRIRSFYQVFFKNITLLLPYIACLQCFKKKFNMQRYKLRY